MKKRNINVELIRIVAMISVVILHYFRHGGGLEWAEFGSREYVIYWCIDAFAFVCVDLFVLVSGYCLINTEFKLSRIVRLWIEVEFYSVLCALLSKALGYNISIIQLLKATIPFTSEAYWYVTAYVVLLCFAPFLNLLLNSIGKKQHFALIIAISLIYVVLPTVFVWMRDLITTGMDYEWFIALYIIGAYIKKYGMPYSSKTSLAVYFSCSLITGLGRVPLGALSRRITGSYILSGLFFRYNSITAVLASVFLFWFLLNFHVKRERTKEIIEKIAPLTFAVYLIHDNCYIRDLIWKTVVPMERLYSGGIGTYLCGLVIVVPSIFLSCCLIEKIRIKIFDFGGYQVFLQRVDLAFEKIKAKISSIV